MDNSSDDSFLWTSGDSSDDTDFVSDNQETSTTMNNHENTESAPRKDYKKDMQTKTINNEYNGKFIKKERSENGTFNSVKLEPDSDHEIRKKKNKKRHTIKTKEEISYDSDDMSDDTFLKMKVKEEQLKYPTMIHKQEKKNQLYNNLHIDEPNCEQENLGTEEVSNVILKQEPLDSDITKRKKKSKKSANNVICDSIIFEKFSEEETVIQGSGKNDNSNVIEKFKTEETEELLESEKCVIKTAVKHKKNKDSHKHKDDLIIGNFGEYRETPAKHKKNKDSHRLNEKETFINSKTDDQETNSRQELYSANTSNEEFGCVENEVSGQSVARLNTDNFQQTQTNQTSSEGLLQVKGKVKSRISDRIRFEDEQLLSSSINVEPVPNMEDFRKQYNLKPFLYKLPKQASISKHDDIWLFKCPHEVDSEALKNVQITLEQTCKVKVAGMTYEATTEPDYDGVCLLGGRNEPSIAHVATNGIITLRRRQSRTPGSHSTREFRSSFLSLPNTKSRHPLFGPRYKKATKLSETVVQRLAAVDTEQNNKKKNKKRKSVQEIVSPLPLEDTDENEKRKRRKRKYSNHRESPPKKVKITKKCDSNSAEVWETAEAIEENLFNF